MKLYKRLKGMSKRTKVGLVTSALYTSVVLAAPVYAAVTQEIKQETVQQVQEITLEQAATVKQLETLYNNKLTEYVSDKILKVDEIENLYKINDKKINLLTNERNVLNTQYSGFEAQLGSLRQEIDKNVKILESTEKIAVLVNTRKNLDEKILCYYLGLTNKDIGNITYSAETLIESELNVHFKKIVIETDKILKQYYQDNRLEILLTKDKFTLNDILTLYGLIQREDYFDKVKNKELNKKINALINERDKISHSNEFVSLSKKIESLDKKISTVSYDLAPFKAYLAQKNNLKEFENRYGNYNRQPCISILKMCLLEKKGLKDSMGEKGLMASEKLLKSQNDEIISNLKSYLRSENLDVKIDDLGNPAKMPINIVASIFLGLLVPIVRNVVLKAYVRGKEAYEIEYMLSLGAGLGNGCIGLFVTDALHPLAFPIRMLTPLILQPAFKLFKFDPCQKIAS